MSQDHVDWMPWTEWRRWELERQIRYHRAKTEHEAELAKTAGKLTAAPKPGPKQAALRGMGGNREA